MPDATTFADPDALTERVAELIAAGRLGVARPLLAAVERLAPSSARLAELRAWLLMRENRFDEAAEGLDRALEDAPDDSPLLRRRAELRFLQGDLAGAAADAAEVVVAAPSDAHAKGLLGSALLGLGSAANAAACLTEAVEAAPSRPAWRLSLAAAQEALGEIEAASETLRHGIAACPQSESLRDAAVRQRIGRQDLEGALAIAERARKDGVAGAELFRLCGRALAGLGRHDEAAAAHAEAFKLAPDDPATRHLAGLNGDRVPADRVRALFDAYASSYEEQRLSSRYRVPGLIRAAVLRQKSPIREGELAGPVLDLGCGTGLGAVALLGCELGPVIGIDLSPAMLSQAAAKRIYDELQEADLETALRDEDRRFSLIIAADVLPYFGPLDALLAAAFRSLRPEGLFVFSCDDAMVGDVLDSERRQPDWLPAAASRYTHRHNYIVASAEYTGFLIAEKSREMLRLEGEAPAMGSIFALRRPL